MRGQTRGLTRSLRAAWSRIAERPARIVATVMAITIGIGFACATVVFTATFQADFAARLSVEYSGADVVVTPTTDEPVESLVSRLDAVPGVAAAVPLYSSGVEYTAAASHNYLSLRTSVSEPRLRWTTLTAGNWPSVPNQIVLDQHTATAANLTIGETFTLTGPSGPDHAAPPTARVTVVGITQTSTSPYGGQLTGFLLPQEFSALGITYAPQIAVLAEPGADAASLAATVGERIGSGVISRTVAEQAQHDVAAFTGQTAALTTVLLGFEAIALVVAGIVIATTFTILLAQRRRQIALLRLVGATTAQVRRDVIVEAMIIGGIGSALGAALGIGVGSIAAPAAGLAGGGTVIPAVTVAVVALVGVALTVGAAWLPASRAMGIPPLAALRPVPEQTHARGVGRVRLTLGISLLLVGGALLAGGVYLGDLIVAMPGGAISAVGVLLLTRSFLPPLLRLIGGIDRAAGVPGRLAVLNAVRNPGRAAATSAALVVGVALIVMLQVAAASVGASIDKASADRYPVDVVVAGDGSPLPAALVDGVRDAKGMAAAAAVHGARATATVASSVESSGAQAKGVGPESGSVDGDPVVVVAAPPNAHDVVRGGLAALDGETPSAPTALVPPWWVGSGAAKIGGTITLSVDGRAQQFTVAVGRLTDAGVLAGSTVVVTQAALDRLAPAAPVVTVWGELAADADASATMAEVNRLVADQPGVQVTGAATDRAALQSVLGTVTAVATGLLAVAVVIAIVGIGNTIGLSVVERTRESALLRALGLRRGQLRLMLLLEAMLLAVVGTVVGLLLGLAYGWAGAAATFNEIGRDLVLSVPWGIVGLLLVIAVAAGALAAVLPARRAVRVMPAQALAEE